MRVRQVLRILSSASGRTLSCALGRRACTECFFGGKMSDNTWTGLRHRPTEAKGALSAFEQIYSMDGASSGRYPSRQFSSVQPEAFLGPQLQQIPTKRATNKSIRRQV